MLRPVGYVYVLTNPLMAEGLVKVGMTDRHNTQQRVVELSTHTGVPDDFVLEYRAQVYNAYQVEQATHAILSDKGFRKSKEFFQCGVLNAVLAIRQAAADDFLGEEIHGDAIKNLDPTELDQQSKNFIFSNQRGLSLTGVTSKEPSSLPEEVRNKAAWKLSSASAPAVWVFYGEKFKTETKVLKQANTDFAGWGQFDNADLLPTDAGDRVKQHLAIQSECDLDNLNYFSQTKLLLEASKLLKLSIANQKRLEMLVNNCGYWLTIEHRKVWLHYPSGIAEQLTSYGATNSLVNLR